MRPYTGTDLLQHRELLATDPLLTAAALLISTDKMIYFLTLTIKTYFIMDFCLGTCTLLLNRVLQLRLVLELVC